MKIVDRSLFLICIAAFVLRVILLVSVVRFPGVADPNHYYNLGVRLVEGHGLTINYIWQYNDVYDSIVHQDDYWMPGTGIIAALGMSVLGVGLVGAILPFAILGAILPFVTYAIAKHLGIGRSARLFSAVGTALLPEFVLNSLRTDTTIPNALLVGVAVLCFIRATQSGTLWWYGFSGVAIGAAYAIRSESILIVPAFVAAALIMYLLNRATLSPRRIGLGVVVLAGITVAMIVPWLLRNLALNGTFSTPTTANMFFLTDYSDHYLFDTRLSLQTMLAAMSPAQLIGKRLFELFATGKLVISTLDALIVPVLGGTILLIVFRDRLRWQVMLPAVILLAGFVLFYPILVPLKSQGGSMKKALLSLLPIFLPVAGYAFEKAITDSRIRAGAWVVTLAITGLNGIELVRQDNIRSVPYMNAISRVGEQAAQLPDLTGDGALSLMTEDPFIFAYYGMSSAVYPSPDRDTIYTVAQRYGIDYMIMPSGRPALDALLESRELDSRFEYVVSVPGTIYQFWRIVGIEASP